MQNCTIQICLLFIPQVFCLAAQPHSWDRYPQLTKEEIERKSLLEDLYYREEKTKQQIFETKRAEAEAKKSETQLLIYKLKAAKMQSERNYRANHDEENS